MSTPIFYQGNINIYIGMNPWDTMSIKSNKKTAVKWPFISGGRAGTVYSHVRFHSMGPFHYVWREQRIRLFLPTGVPNPFTGSRPLSPTQKNGHTNGRLFLVDAQGLEPWTH